MSLPCRRLTSTQHTNLTSFNKYFQEYQHVADSLWGMAASVTVSPLLLGMSIEK